MRKTMLLALGAIIGMGFAACGNKQQPQPQASSDTTLVDSSKIKDVTIFGLCGENAAMNSPAPARRISAGPAGMRPPKASWSSMFSPAEAISATTAGRSAPSTPCRSGISL